MRISELIRENTSKAQRELEKLLLHRVRRTERVEDYVRLLQVFYGFYLPLEKAIMQQVSDQQFQNQGSASKSYLLLSDISSMHNTTVVNECGELPEVNSPARAIGVLFALENTFPGGKSVIKMIRQKLEGYKDVALNFFEGCADQTETKLSELQHQLEKHAINSSQEVIMAAEETFRKLGDWLLKTNDRAGRYSMLT